MSIYLRVTDQAIDNNDPVLHEVVDVGEFGFQFIRNQEWFREAVAEHLEAQITPIFKAYVECALWSSLDNDDLPLDDRFCLEDIDGESQEEIVYDIYGFLCVLQEQNIPWRDEWTLEEFGHDFWLTRNGHGTGFWDRGRSLGGVLTKWAKVFGEQYLYVGEYGELHVS